MDKILQKWLGEVVYIGKDDFVASMSSIEIKESCPPAGERVFPNEDVDPADMPLLKLGAEFYWTVGYEGGPSGRVRVGMMRFKRIPDAPQD